MVAHLNAGIVGRALRVIGARLTKASTISITVRSCGSRTEGREAWAVLCIEAEGVREKVHDAPDGEHEEEADDAVHGELPSFLALLLVARARDEVLEHAPEEHDERNCEHERHQHAVDKPNNPDDKISEFHIGEA